MNKNNFSFDWPNFNWAKSVNHYEEVKKNPFQGRSYSPIPRITQKEIKAGEVYFNPITQKYNNKEVQEKTCYQEYSSLPQKIANNYDKTLRYEQTFDIINLKDKLRVFKNHPLYPVEKESIGNKKLKDMSKIEYNILSNTNLTRHHFDKPENRPNKPSTSPVIKPLKKQVWTFKDYDIISNKYLAEHEDKAKVNEQAFKLEAANKYWKTHTFDPVVGKYFDPKTEENYQIEQKKLAAVWGKDRVLRLPKRVQEQGLLYNPVNQIILDEERLTAFDLKQKNKKKRYERKNDIEEFILRKGISYSERDETRKMNKKCYDYYRETDNRGYDIVNFDKNYNKYKGNLNLKDHMNDWDVLKNKSSTITSTFGNKKIFKDEYDYSDANKHFHEFKENRNRKIKQFNIFYLEFLSSLPKISNDVLFKRSQIKGVENDKANVSYVWGNKDKKSKLSDVSKKETYTKSTYDIPGIIQKQELNLHKDNFFNQPKEILTKIGKSTSVAKKYLSSINSQKEEVVSL